MYHGLLKYNCYLLFILFIIFFKDAKADATKIKDVVAVKGVIDIREVDLQKTTVHLRGDWGFYWKKLLAPNSFDSAKPAYLPFPQLWNNTVFNGKRLSPFGYATYTLTVLLPKEKQDLALQIPDVYSSYRLYINGVEFASNGNPDSTKERSIPKWISK
ncbi:MAG: ATPase, partial [Bacteroidota bacterium]|nr:ATPase [Bacteroidota bacterium]